MIPTSIREVLARLNASEPEIRREVIRRVVVRRLRRRRYGARPIARWWR